MKEIYEMHGRGHSARAIARGLGLARNTVLRYLNSPEAMLPKPRPPQGSQLDKWASSSCQRNSWQPPKDSRQIQQVNTTITSSRSKR